MWRCVVCFPTLGTYRLRLERFRGLCLHKAAARRHIAEDLQFPTRPLLKLQISQALFLIVPPALVLPCLRDNYIIIICLPKCLILYLNVGIMLEVQEEMKLKMRSWFVVLKYQGKPQKIRLLGLPFDTLMLRISSCVTTVPQFSGIQFFFRKLAVEHS